MNRTSRTFFALSVLFVVSACRDPARDKPKAEVGGPVASAMTPTPANAERLTVAPQNSSIAFTASKVTRSHQGKFNSFSGSADLVGGRAEGSKITIDVDLASVQVDVDKLTQHLKSADFFDVGRYPKAHFESSSITAGGASGATHTVSGALDLHGVKKTITFPATITVRDDAVVVKSEFSINRKDFGIVYPGAPDDLIRDDVLLKVDLTLPRKRT